MAPEHEKTDTSVPIPEADEPGSKAVPSNRAAEPADEPGATWNPAAGDEFFKDDVWGVDPASGSRPAPPPEAGHDPAAQSSGRAKTTAQIERLWGTSFAAATPGMTLKGGGTVKPQPASPSGFVPTPPAGTEVQLEGFELLKVLGEGGVGVVYEARQKSIDRQIAVKMIKPRVGQDPAEKAKFLTEAMVTGKLDHPNIVPIHDLGQTADGRPFYAMKMVRGTPWSRVIREYALPENLRILLDVCDAVAFAHSKGVIHRDLKPENVMLGEFGEVQLMDWGLGTVIGSASAEARVSESQAAGGTPAYMAPEMVTGEEVPVGFHSDVYLLGAILWEVISGKPPHGGARIMECLQNALDNVIQPTDKGGVLVEIALTAMQTRPEDRYPSVKDFKQALLDYQAHAESINLCDQAHETLRRACAEENYEAYAEALFGYRQALQLWAENDDARDGIAETQWEYARCAFRKGDLDLAASTLDPACPGHAELAAEVAAARRKRAGARRLLKLFKVVVVTLTAAVIVILTVASIWIAAAKHQAEVAREAAVEAKNVAVAAREAEAEQRRQAEAARTKAQAEEARAVQALNDLEQAVQAMIAAQTREEEAQAKARAADLVAAETRDELARTGMLLDNSWWVFDADAARRKQEEAAQTLEMPAELTITLADGVRLELVLIPAGSFAMGSPPKEEKRAADEYVHRVEHTRAYYLARHELSEAQWQAATGSPPPGAGERAAAAELPATGMSVELIETVLWPALEAHAPPGWRFRLPTEAEWEYACRAGTPTAYHTGDDVAALDTAGWFLANSGHKVQPAGGKVPNAFGLHDLHGNVSEICVDLYRPGFYLESPVADPLATGEGEQYVVRGGSVLNTPEHCRSAYRSYVYRKNQYEFVGLRPALVRVSAP